MRKVNTEMLAIVIGILALGVGCGFSLGVLQFRSEIDGLQARLDIAEIEIIRLDVEVLNYQWFFDGFVNMTDDTAQRHNAGRDVVWVFETDEFSDSAVLYIEGHVLKRVDTTYVSWNTTHDGHTTFSESSTAEFSFSIPDEVDKYLCIFIFFDGNKVIEMRAFNIIADRAVF